MFLERIPTISNPDLKAVESVRELLEIIAGLAEGLNELVASWNWLSKPVPVWGTARRLVQVVVFVLLMGIAYTFVSGLMWVVNLVGGFAAVLVISAIGGTLSVVIDAMIAKRRPDIAETDKAMWRLLNNLTWLHAAYKEELAKLRSVK